MKRELSSKLTIITKIILPGFIILVMGIITLTMFFGPDAGGQPPPKFPFLGMEMFVVTALYFTVMKYKKVAADDKFLYVSNYLKEIEIPLSSISDVTEIVWIRGHPMTIHLKTPSDFGSRITFTPKSKGFRFFSSNPLVEELKELAKNAERGSRI